METHKVNEASEAKFTCTIVDQAGVGIEPGNMNTLTVTIFDMKTDAVITNALNVLNANNGTLASGGAFTYIFSAADNAIQGTDSVEAHIALFEWTWDSGTKSGNHSVKLMVQNARRVS